LLGLILLYQSVPAPLRSFDIRALTVAASLGQIAADAQHHIYLLLLIGFGILVSLFPFHTWAPEAYASAPAPAAMLHAGVLKKFGLYGLLRLAIPLLPEGARHWTTLLVVLLLGNIIYVGLVTIAQKRLDWMLGYSSVMHMGYIFPWDCQCWHSWRDRRGRFDVRSWSFDCSAICSCRGITATNGHIGFRRAWRSRQSDAFRWTRLWSRRIRCDWSPGLREFCRRNHDFFGAFKNGWTMDGLHIFQIATVLALWGVVISTVYMLRAYRKTFMGTVSEEWKQLVDLRPTLRVPVTLLVGALLCYGFFPQSFVRLVAPIFHTLSLRDK
jgi:NADH:ubiquinone oxidoreductase subunit 4 (chain M)